MKNVNALIKQLQDLVKANPSVGKLPLAQQDYNSPNGELAADCMGVYIGQVMSNDCATKKSLEDFEDWEIEEGGKPEEMDYLVIESF